MELRWATDIYCDVCGDVCMHVKLSRVLTPKGMEGYGLKHTVFSELWLHLERDQYRALMDLFPKKEFGKLYEMNREYVPFYCPVCKISYCRKHWNSWAEDDEEGYYDAEYGICPKGHKRMLYD